MRLDKLLAHSGYGTRKEVKEYIRKGYVVVNGLVVKNDDFKVDEENDEIFIANQEVDYTKYAYYLLNKPKGYVSATIDSNPTVVDLIEDNSIKNIFPVGRLDIDTTGTLLLTNDGDLAHRLLRPKSHVNKVYNVVFEGEFKKEFIYEFENGIVLDDGYKTLPSNIEKTGENECRLTIHEGKFHQVKRMFESLGLKVVELNRESFSFLNVDNLRVGEYRNLTEEEILRLKEN